MTKEQLQNVANEAWLGRLRVFKPKKNEKIGIPYKPWHHIAFIDNVVFTYVWDTREIVDAFPMNDVTYDFETIKITDSGKALRFGSDTTNRAMKLAKQLKAKYADLPIATENEALNLQVVKDLAADALLDVDVDIFDIHDDGKIVFVDKSIELPEDLYMYAESVTVNPNKRKFADNNAYAGIAKYFATQARCAILTEWSKQIKNK